MRDMASLLSKPMTPAPADNDAAGGELPGGGGLQSMLGGGQQGGQGQQPPSPEQFGAMLDHLGAFRTEWQHLLSLPDIGKKDVKGPIMEMMADMMGEGYVTLAQTMAQLKDLPTTPLGQKQWVQEHLQKTNMASMIAMQQQAQLYPLNGDEPDEVLSPKMKSPRERNHHEMMQGAMKFYDRGKR